MEESHTWFSSFAAQFNPGDIVVVDWCIRCGDPNPERGPHIQYEGKSRKVEDVEPPEGIL